MPVDPVRLKSCRRDPGSLLARQIEALAGVRASVTLERERPWASITFTGTRHSLVAHWNGLADPDVIKKLARTLPKHEFAIPGHFIADLLVIEQTQTHLRLEALSITDPVQSERS
jgi:hypothetical protein